MGEVVRHLGGEVASGKWAGNLAMVEGAVGAGVGITREETVLIALRGHAAAILSSAVRLGRLGTTRSQALLYELTSDLQKCAQTAMDTSLDEMRSTLPELEIHAARHEHRRTRLFVS
jgi:urease accessory protein